MDNVSMCFRINRISHFLSTYLILALSLCAGTSCSVSLPDNKIACTSDLDCPKDWWCDGVVCHSHTRTGFQDSAIYGGDATGIIVTDASSVLDKTGITGTDCDSVVVSCGKDQCGTITDKCGRKITCPSCPAGYSCIDNKQCISVCNGCLVGGNCFQPGFANPDNQCEVCTPTTSKSAFSANDGAVCNDTQYCTETDKCSGNTCKGTARNCDDKCDCTKDSCSEAQKGCINESNCATGMVCDCGANQCKTRCDAGECTISGVCYKNGDTNSTNPCQVCNASKNATAWSLQDVGYACGAFAASANVCAGQDACDKSGQCVPNRAKEGTPCGDSSTTECSAPDTCDGNGNCLANHKGTDVKCGGNPAACYLQDYCDGNGNCADKGFDAWAACGGATSCSYGSSCNPNTKSCAPNLVPAGTVCESHTGLCENNKTCNSSGNCAFPGEGRYKSAGAYCDSTSSSNGCSAKQCNSSHSCNYVGGNACTLSSNSNPCVTGKCSGGKCQETPVSASSNTVCRKKADNYGCKKDVYCDGTATCPTATNSGWMADGTECGSYSGCYQPKGTCSSGECNAIPVPYTPGGGSNNTPCPNTDTSDACQAKYCDGSGSGQCVTEPKNEGVTYQGSKCGTNNSNEQCKESKCVQGICNTTNKTGTCTMRRGGGGTQQQGCCNNGQCGSCDAGTSG